MLKKLIVTLNKFFNSIAMIALVIMMLSITADVVARYVLDHSISVVYTLTESYLMVIVVFLGMAYTHYKDDHIQFKLVANLLPAKVLKGLNIITHLFALLFFAVIGYEGVLLTHEAWMVNAQTGGLVSLPMHLSYIWVPLGAFLMVIISALKIAESITMLFSADKQSEEA